VSLSDPAVARLLNDAFVPCWESVRPVPQVTISFGDGRTLKRTLAGNTVISILLPDGHVVDAFPGVYTPAHLAGEINTTLAFLKERAPSLKDGPPPAEVLAWHRGQVAVAARSEALRTTMSKALVEAPLLNALGAQGGPVIVRVSPSRVLTDKTPIPVTNPKAALEALSARLEDTSKRAATVEQVKAQYAKLPPEEQLTPEQLGRKVVELDSTTNVRLVRPAVHLLFATYDRLPTARECRDAVFKQILHVPVDDPYLGLTDALVPGTPGGE
jgi:hypothetical protein